MRLIVQGVNSTVLLDPFVAVLLRQGISCPLLVPLPCVIIVDLNVTDGATAPYNIIVSPSSPVNVVAGNCSAQSFMPSRRLRRLSAPVTYGDVVIVTLSVGGANATALAGLLYALAAPEDDTTEEVGGDSFKAFVVGAAGTAGVSSMHVSVRVAGSSVTPSKRAQSSSSSTRTLSGMSTGAVVGVAVGGGILVLLLILFFLRQRRKATAPKGQPVRVAGLHGTGDGGGDAAGFGVYFINPVLHHRTRRQSESPGRLADLRCVRSPAGGFLTHSTNNMNNAAIACANKAIAASAKPLPLRTMGYNHSRTAGSRTPGAVVATRAILSTAAASPSSRNTLASCAVLSRGASVGEATSRASPKVARSSAPAPLPRVVTVGADGTIMTMSNAATPRSGSGPDTANRSLASFSNARSVADAGAATRTPAASALAAMHVYSSVTKKTFVRRAEVPGGLAQPESAGVSTAQADSSLMQSNPVVRLGRGKTMPSSRTLTVSTAGTMIRRL